MAEHKIYGNDGAGNVQALDYDRRQVAHLQAVVDRLNAVIDKQNTDCEDLSAQLAIANAMADKARDAALVEAAFSCDAQKAIFLSSEYAIGQPLASYAERFACGCCAASILALRDKPAPAVLPLLPDMVDAATAAGVVVWWDNEAQEIKMAVTVQEAARVLLDAFMRKDIDPLDAVDPQIEALAIKHSGNRGDPVIQLEIAEEFFCAALRSIAASEA